MSPAQFELCHCIANSGTFQAIGPAVEDDELQKERQLETCPLEDGKEGDVETLLALPIAAAHVQVPFVLVLLRR